MNEKTRRWLETAFGEKARDIKGPSKIYEFGRPETFEIKQVEGTEDFFIEGYASTKTLDLGSDVVLPEAFEEAMVEYQKNPIIFFMHAWYGLAIGRMDDHRIDEKGLWVRDYISMTAVTIRTLIREKILRGLSIGFDPIEIEYINKGQPTQYRLIKKLKLYEHSVVNIPMNPEALMEEASSKGFDINLLTLAAKEAGQEEREMLFKMFTKHYDQGDGGGGAATTVPTDINARVNSIDLKVGNVNEKLDNIGRTLTSIQEAAKNTVSKDELNVLMGKAKDDLMAAQKAWWKEQVPGRKFVHDISQATPLAKDLKTPSDLKAAVVGRPAAEVADDFGLKEEQVRRFQKMQDDLMIVHYAMIAGNASYRNNPDISQLKSYKRFASYLSQFQKALNTQIAGSGADWVPEQWSGDLMERIEVERRLAKFFTRFPQPTQIFNYPIRGTKPRVYIKSEATADYPAGLKHSTPGTGKIIFEAKGLAGALSWSDELEEDSIVAILPLAKEDLVTAFVDAEEDIVINGDDSETHQDSDVAALAADDYRKLHKGLRKLCNSGAKYDITTGTTGLTASDVVTVIKKSGKYGVNPLKTFLAVPVSTYFEMLSFSEVKTIDLWGQNATYMRGALSAFIGRPIFPSEFIREDLNATGIYDGQTTNLTIFLHCNFGSFKIGDRRMVTMEVDKEITTGLFRLVGTQRWSFKKMVATADNPVSLGYKVTP